MKSTILLLAVFAAIFTSCSTSYKTGQTPDDVYYSPTRPQQEEYVESENKDEQEYKGSDDYYDDRYLRMKVQNRSRWSELDDWYFTDYRYRRYYSYNNNYCCCNSSWNAHSYWNSYYNPYYHNYVIINPKATFAYSSPRTFNLNTYYSNSSSGNSNSNPKYSSYNTGANNSYNGPRTSSNSSSNNNNSNSGNVLRSIFKNNNSGSSGNNSGSSSGNNNNSSSNSSSGSSSSSSSAPVRKF